MTPAFDIDAIAAQVQRPVEAPLSMDACPWLAESWAEPAAFRAALLAALRRAAPSLKSHPAQGYDLYHDAVQRHAGGDAAALVSYDREGAVTTVSYAELHARSARLMTSLASRGVAAGQGACVIAPVGPDLLVLLAAALRLGLVVSYLPPRGDRYLALRLGALRPAVLLTTPALSPQLRGLPGPWQVFTSALSEVLGPTAAGSFGYPPGAPALRLFSPLRPGHAPVTLCAEAAFGGALRDGLLVLGLDPGRRLVALGLHAEQHQPLLLLSALLLGATYVHLEIDALRAEPLLLSQARAEALFVAPEALPVLPLGGLDVPRWFVSVATISDWVREPPPALRRSPCAHLYYEAAGGGCLLFSARQRRAPAPLVLPAPGMKVALKQPAPPAQQAVGPVGVLTTELSPQGHVMLARRGGAYVFGGALTPRRDGRVYPEDEVVAAIAGLDFVVGAVVAPVPDGAQGDRARMVLLVFVGVAGAGGAAARAEVVRARLRRALGDEALPDEILFVPLHPRRRDGPLGEVDAAWARARYQDGTLAYMASRPVFQTLAALRQLCLRVAGARPAGG